MTVKQDKIDKAKKSAPGVPGDTCPYIDFVLSVMDQLTGHESSELAPKEIRDKQLELATETLEYIREANSTLRESSRYWYDQYKKVV